MITKALLLAAAATAIAAAAPASAVSIDLSGTDYAQSSVTQTFGAGDYVVSFATSGLYKAWAPATPATAPNGLTGNWDDRYATTIGGTTTQLNPFSGARFATADAAYDAFKGYTTSFSLTQDTAVTFSIPDGQFSFGDNSGGVSLDVSAVPEPASWAMMMMGIGTVGFAMRQQPARRRMAQATA